MLLRITEDFAAEYQKNRVRQNKKAQLARSNDQTIKVRYDNIR
jgi:hypothetical protein